MGTPFVFAAGVLGAILASFLEVVADRLPRGEKPFGRSHCDHCGRTLSWFELIPVLSWLLLRGRCRTCDARIPIRHLLFEVSLGAVFASVAATAPYPVDPWLLGIRFTVLSVLAVVLLADLRYFIIPDTASLGLFVLASFLVLAAARFSVPWASVIPPIEEAILGAIFGATLLGVFALVSRGTWMGWGDVKLATALGVLLGFPDVLLLLAFAFMAGAVVGLVLVGTKRRAMQDLLPFGPFIVLGTLPFLFGFGPAIERFFGLQDFLDIL
ncbi:MAG: hypothetical protein A2682_02515 [Candidatus Terrybacteria bacterium RIFCSPHIGHO2_01_FULL_58_15]|uniref:Prepilin peptidase n=1 Tax=Terrybacteria sp. (strain RIFCSPHIGHO2_01_FULL_58_15) TaxID=1802363 RepID=A0A1G2PJY8_TERXR|nr:MAG: hypothetical protein A2682_02515 [Candidatus Terrybacteria bacterium RIFCSPHIGHO2_01_FULL_58_15]